MVWPVGDQFRPCNHHSGHLAVFELPPAHQKLEVDQCCPYETVCKVMMPDLLVWLGGLMDTEAVALAQQPLDELPPLKTLQGHSKRKIDKSNQFILMNKLKDQSSNRKRIASTHEELAPKHGDLVEREAHITVALYNAKVAKTFAPENCPRQFSTSWDPSDYSGRNTLVSTLYSPHLDCAAYMPNQMIRKVIMADLQESFIEEAKSSKLGTLAGYSELRALSHALLQATGCSLMDFRIPENLLARPLKVGKARVLCEGRWYIVGPGDLIRLEIPTGLDLSKIPALVSCSDQGPTNTASLNFCSFAGERLMIQVTYDSYHRGWNDVKLSAKRSLGYPWKVMLKLIIVFNINYSPFGSSGFFYKKQDALQNYMTARTFKDPAFQSAIPNICRERHIAEPQSADEEEELFKTLPHMNNMVRKGPLIKLLRWMSFFEVALEWKGDMFATKLILESDTEEVNATDVSEAKTSLEKLMAQGEDLKEKRDAKKEVDALKKSSGVWKLAPKVVNHYNLATLDMLLLTRRATWKWHSERARNIVQPAQTLEYNLAACRSNFWAHELEDMVASLWRKDELVHMYPESNKESNEKLLLEHLDFFHHLMSCRTTSLASAFTLPPMRWNGVLDFDPEAAAKHRTKLLEEWGMVLRLEAASLQPGKHKIECLERMYWRLGTFVRVLALAHEKDQSMNLSCQTGSAHPLQMLLAKGLGDSRVIEVAHQCGPDIQRSSRHNETSQINVMFGTINSKALEQRKTNKLVTVEPHEVIFSSKQRKVSVKHSLNPCSHKLDEGMQRMMRRRQGANHWPSPAPASLFPSLACTEWVFSFLRDEHPGASLDDAWLSCIAGRCGDLIAHKASGQGLAKFDWLQGLFCLIVFGSTTHTSPN